jgi:citrate lyase subunit gamma (acyl carrier protein)
MEIKKVARAGSVESNDILIIVEPSDSGINIDLESDVYNEYGNKIKQIINEVLKENDVKNINIKAVDKGALDFVIKSRTEVAIKRASDCESI